MQVDSNTLVPKKRITRVELLEERLVMAEEELNKLKETINEEDTSEIQFLEKILDHMNSIKAEIDRIRKEESDQIIKKSISDLKEIGLFVLNIEKFKIIENNEKEQEKFNKQEAYIKYLEKEVMNQRLLNDNLNKRNSEIIEVNSNYENQILNLRSRAYGYDIAKKYEVYQNKKSNVTNISAESIRKNDEKIAFNYWEKENFMNKHNSKLEDLAKDKHMWISNKDNNLEKILRSMESNTKLPDFTSDAYTVNLANGPSTNLRKYSPMILNNY